MAAKPGSVAAAMPAVRCFFTDTKAYQCGTRSVSDDLDPFKDTVMDEAQLLQDFLLSAEFQTAIATELYIDSSRRDILEKIAPKLHGLVRGELVGQESCFILLGPRGVGKSVFLRSLAAAVALAAPPTTHVIFVNWKSNPIQTPAAIIAEHMKLGGGVDTTSIDAIHGHLRNYNARVLLVIDELEAFYRLEDRDFASVVHQQLHAIGEGGSGSVPRHIVAITSGSAAVLRKLAFSIGGYTYLKEQYKRYLDFASLNDTKFVAVVLRPLGSLEETSTALAAMMRGNKRLQKLVELAGLLIADDEVDQRLQTFMMLTRGTPRSFEGVAKVMAKSTADPTKEVRMDLADALFKSRVGGTESRAVFGTLFDLWKQGTRGRCAEAALDCRRVADFRASFTDFKNELGARLNTEVSDDDVFKTVYEAADKRILWYDPTARELSFLHPFDAASYILIERGPEGSETSVELSDAEKLSLLCPNLPSADELNERLVFEGLVHASKAGALQIAGVPVRPLTMPTENAHLRLSDKVDKADDTSGLTTTYLLTSPSHCIFKEFPDIFGADGIVHALPDYVIRIQVKCSGKKLDAQHPIGGPKVQQDWIEPIRRSNTAIRELLQKDMCAVAASAAAAGKGGVPGADEPARSIVAAPKVLTVMWVAQALYAPAAEALAAMADTLVVTSASMFPLWSPRVQAFVRDSKLTQYGFKAHAAVAAARAE